MNLEQVSSGPRRRPIDEAVDDLERRILAEWPEVLNRWELRLGGGVLLAMAVFLSAVVMLVSGTAAEMFQKTMAAAGLACLVGPVGHHLLRVRLAKAGMRREVRSWMVSHCHAHGVSLVEVGAVLEERARLTIARID